MTRRASLDGGDAMRWVLDYARLRQRGMSEQEIAQRYEDGEYDHGALEEPDGPREDADDA